MTAGGFVGFQARICRGLSGFLEEPDINLLNVISRLSPICRVFREERAAEKIRGLTQH